jgi:hypothetical protein
MTSTIEENNSVGSLLQPLLKKVTPVVGSRMLWVLPCDHISNCQNGQQFPLEIEVNYLGPSEGIVSLPANLH